MTVDRAAPAEGARLRRPRWRDPRLLVGLVLVLASGFDQRRTVQRGLERSAGTALGVGVAALVLALRPSGLVLIGAIAAVVYGAQLLVQRVELPDFVEVAELDDTTRGVGGYGSSGGHAVLDAVTASEKEN